MHRIVYIRQSNQGMTGSFVTTRFHGLPDMWRARGSKLKSWLSNRESSVSARGEMNERL